MNKDFIKLIHTIKKTHGSEILTNARKLRSFLADYADGNYRGEIRNFLLALEDYFGDDETQLKDYAWYGESYVSGSTHPVGQKKSNAWGLYDMHGNVWEWCHDRDGDYPTGSITDPKGPSSGGDRVFRGGGWSNIFIRLCRSASRNRNSPDIRDGCLGFRLAFSPRQQ